MIYKENKKMLSTELLMPAINYKKYYKLGIIILGLFIVIFFGWGSLAPLSAAVEGQGKVIVASKNQIIQYQEQGIIKKIHVFDGDRVKNGDILVTLDNTQVQSQLDIVLSQYYTTLALNARLLAERDNQPIIFDDELLKLNDSLIKNKIMTDQRMEFFVRHNQNIQNENILMQQIKQIQENIGGLKELNKYKNNLIFSYNEDLKGWEALYKKQLADNTQVTNLKREIIKLEGEISNNSMQILQLNSKIAEIKATISNDKQIFLKDVVKELRETENKLLDLKSKIVASEDMVNKSKILASSDGIITNSKINSIGGVIPPGETLMEILPDNQPLIIEAMVPINNIQNINVGLKAEIRFPNFSHIGSLNFVTGEVIYVAADAIEDEQKRNKYYVVKIEITNDGKAELMKNNLVIKAGMPASILIITAKRTFIDYIIKPIKDRVVKAFNEE